MQGCFRLPIEPHGSVGTGFFPPLLCCHLEHKMHLTLCVKCIFVYDLRHLHVQVSFAT